MSGLRGVCSVLVVVVGTLVLGGATASAEVSPRRAPVAKTRTAKARVPATTEKVASLELGKDAAPDQALSDVALPTAPSVAPALDTATVVTPDLLTPPATRTGRPMPPPTAAALMIQYQRLGRELMKLRELRGTTCTLELWTLFRALKVDGNVATAGARAMLAATLADLQLRLERTRGITIHQSCLDNPLAPECQ